MINEETTTMAAYKNLVKGGTYNPTSEAQSVMMAAVEDAGFDRWSDLGNSFELLLMSACDNAYDTDFSLQTEVITYEDAEARFIAVFRCSAEELLEEYMGEDADAFRKFLKA